MEQSWVSCLSWVKRGAAKQHLEKVKHTKEELQEIIKEMKLREAEYEGRPKTEAQNNVVSSDSDDDDKNEVDDFYGMDDYDDDVGDAISGIDQGVEHLLLNNVPETDSEDSDAEPEEFTVKPTDNLILAGRIDKDIPMLEIMVFNHTNEEFFILHDILLPSFPFAIEWLDFNPSDAENKGNFAAIGGITPEIDLWDLNVRGSLEPALRLGAKKKNQRHTDAVLDLSWNQLTRNVLASGSVDRTVMVWDLAQNISKMRLTCFEEKVQSLKWHSSESHNLLVGSCEGKVRLFDCRSLSTFKTWIFDGEIERVLWNDNNPIQFYSATDKGMVHLLDIRQTKPLWSLKAHEKEVTGITVDTKCPDLMATASMDETVKIWDMNGSVESPPSLVCQKFMNIGPIFTLNSCPDVPYVFCAGGSKKDNYLYLWDARDNDAVLTRFVNKKRSTANSNEKSTMDVEENPQPCSSTSLGAVENSVGGRVQRQSRPKKKKSKSAEGNSSTSTEKKKSKKTSHKNLHPKSRKDTEDK